MEPPHHLVPGPEPRGAEKAIMRCLKRAIAREMYRELPATTGVASRL